MSKILIVFFFAVNFKNIAFANDLTKNNQKHNFTWAFVNEAQLPQSFIDIFITALQFSMFINSDQFDFQAKNINFQDPHVDIIFRVTTKAQAAKEMQQSRDNGFILNGANAYTTTYQLDIGKISVVFILWDEIMYINNRGQMEENPLAFANLLVTIGHELYGNAIPSLIEKPLRAGKSLQEMQAANEVRAYRKGIKFVEKALNEPKLSLKTRQDLQTLLMIERQRLIGWSHALKKQDNVVNFLAKKEKCSGELSNK